MHDITIILVVLFGIMAFLLYACLSVKCTVCRGEGAKACTYGRDKCWHCGRKMEEAIEE
jgi:hypothetical protein